jgi:hypothetical protein
VHCETGAPPMAEMGHLRRIDRFRAVSAISSIATEFGDRAAAKRKETLMNWRVLKPAKQSPYLKTT